MWTNCPFLICLIYSNNLVLLHMYTALLLLSLPVHVKSYNTTPNNNNTNNNN